MIIEIKLDTSNTEELRALSALVQSLQGQPLVVKDLPEAKVETIEAPEKPKQEEKPKKQTPKKEEPKVETSITLEDLKKLTREKTQANQESRDKAKAKITELGSENVTKLDPSKYDEFKTFLESLP